MPPTVKSLEERIDDIAEHTGRLEEKFDNRFDTLSQQLPKSSTDRALLSQQVSMFAANQIALQSELRELARIVAANSIATEKLNMRLDAGLNGLARNNNILDTGIMKFEAHTNDYLLFKGSTDTAISVMKWIGRAMAAMFVSVIATSFVVIRTAGSLEVTVQQQQKAIAEIRRDISELRYKPKP